jgi:hypothetical protein
MPIPDGILSFLEFKTLVFHISIQLTRASFRSSSISCISTHGSNRILCTLAQEYTFTILLLLLQIHLRNSANLDDSCSNREWRSGACSCFGQTSECFYNDGIAQTRHHTSHQTA